MKRRSLAPAKFAAIGLGALALVGLTISSASQLNLNAGTLQAGVTDLADCQNGTVQVSFTNAFAAGEYKVQEIAFNDVDVACSGKTLKAAFLDAADQPLGAPISASVTGTGTVTVTGLAVSAAQVTSVAVVIHD